MAESKPVVVEARPVEVLIGGTAAVVVVVAVDEGFHLQANPVPFDYLIPTRLEVEGVDGLEIGQAMYPPGKPYRLQGSADTLSVYDGVLEIALPLRVRAGAHPGRYRLRGVVSYQRCDDRMCFRPSSQPVEIRVRVVEAAVAAGR